jgi:3-oxoacyl-[acyl-carrier-protein] synthase-1
MSPALPTLAVVVGVGARTPLGLDAQQTGMFLRTGFAAMDQAALGPAGEPITICHQPAISGDLRGIERAIALSQPALDEALATVAEPLGAGTRAKLIVNLDPAVALDEAGAGRLAAALHRSCRSALSDTSLTVGARGEAGAGFALAEALVDLDKGEIDAVILGGVHTDYDEQAIARLAQQGRLQDNENLDSIIPGEAAAVVVLTSERHASRADLPIQARLCGLATAMEAARFDNDVPAALARGATKAMQEATASLEERELHAGWVLSDLGFELWRMREWQSILVRANSILGPPYRIDTPAHRIGALGAAALPLCLTLAAEGFRADYAPSPIALIMAGSEAGERAAMVVTAAR